MEVKEKMSQSFELKYDFVEKWGRLSKPEHLQIYIYMLMRFKKDGVYISPDEIKDKLHLRTRLVHEALEFWSAAGCIEFDGNTYSFIEETPLKTKRKTEKPKKAHLRMRPSYTSEEIDAAASINDKIDFMFKEAERILGKLLSTTDLELLYSFVDWLGLPVEVVIMLLNYASKLGKTDKRYLETLAIDWADREINTYDAAEAFIKEMEDVHSNEHKIRSVLGIYDRALTQTEKKYIKAWTSASFTPELISLAYDRTVEGTGKLSFAYMNKILQSWQESGVKTEEDIKTQEDLYKIKNSPVKKKSNKRSKFNNFEDTNKLDYSRIAEELLNDMLDE